MEIGKQIKQLRLRRGLTQEALAKALGCSSQAVSKWERGETAPDVGMLPSLSTFFGVTIDELFTLSDDVRMERLENMIWNVRFITPEEAKSAEDFLLEKGRREPENGKPYELLAQLENSLAAGHRARAAEYAKEALAREPDLAGAHAELVQAMGGHCPDWNAGNHCALIAWYRAFLEKNPGCVAGWMWLLDQLLDALRFEEAEVCQKRLAQVDRSFRAELYRGIIAWYRGDREGAKAIWANMEVEPQKEWLREFNLGDFLARAGEFEEAKAHYREALRLQAPPRYTDTATSIAQICELQGDHAGAIAAWEEELAILKHDWNTTSGEPVDRPRREIARLQACMARSARPAQKD